MPLPIPFTTKPMEAEPVDELPRGVWLYDPKLHGSPAFADLPIPPRPLAGLDGIMRVTGLSKASVYRALERV